MQLLLSRLRCEKCCKSPSPYRGLVLLARYSHSSPCANTIETQTQNNRSNYCRYQRVRNASKTLLGYLNFPKLPL